MNDTHTPGPWKYEHNCLDNFRLDAGDVNIIGGCGCCGSPSINSEANARLIASAPDLLEALIAARDLIDVVVPFEGDVFRKINSVIARAIGETQ